MDCNIGKVLYIGIFVDFIFGLNSELRVVVEVYVYSNVKEKFVNDFVNVWIKVMIFDCFDLCYDFGKLLNM